MTITITNAEGSMAEITSEVVSTILKDKGKELRLLTAAQCVGLLDITMTAFLGLGLSKIDVLGNGRVIRYRLSDLEALLQERTIRGTKRKGARP